MKKTPGSTATALQVREAMPADSTTSELLNETMQDQLAPELQAKRARLLEALKDPTNSALLTDLIELLEGPQGMSESQARPSAQDS